MFEALAKRNTTLHVHISRENKQYLMTFSKQLNCKMGVLVDEILTKLRTKQWIEKKL